MTLIPGDGIGPEVIGAAVEVVAAAGVAIEWDVHDVGTPAVGLGRPPLPEEVLDSLRANGVGLKGPVSTAAGKGFRSVNVELRRRLDLFAQVRPARSRPRGPSPFQPFDVVVIRETTEDLYAGFEFPAGSRDAKELSERLRARGEDVSPDSAFSLKPLSAAAARRIAEFAIDYARRHGRRRVTAVHKATVMRETDGLFLTTAREVASGQSDVLFDDLLVDNAAAQLVRRPDTLDVLVMPNLYGDILSDLAAALAGGVGLAPGANYGPDVAVFEAAHGSAPRYAGQDRANPMAAILSAALLLHHLGEHVAAEKIERAVETVLADGRTLTFDVGRARNEPKAAGTRAVAAAVAAKAAGCT